MTEQSETLVKAGPVFPEFKTASPRPLARALWEPNAATEVGTARPPRPPARSCRAPPLPQASSDRLHIARTAFTYQTTFRLCMLRNWKRKPRHEGEQENSEC